MDLDALGFGHMLKLMLSISQYIYLNPLVWPSSPAYSKLYDEQIFVIE